MSGACRCYQHRRAPSSFQISARSPLVNDTAESRAPNRRRPRANLLRSRRYSNRDCPLSVSGSGSPRGWEGCIARSDEEGSSPGCIYCLAHGRNGVLTPTRFATRCVANLFEAIRHEIIGHTRVTDSVGASNCPEIPESSRPHRPPLKGRGPALTQKICWRSVRVILRAMCKKCTFVRTHRSPDGTHRSGGDDAARATGVTSSTTLIGNAHADVTRLPR